MAESIELSLEVSQAMLQACRGGLGVEIFFAVLFGRRCRRTEGGDVVLRSSLSNMIASPAVASTGVHQVEDAERTMIGLGQGSREFRLSALAEGRQTFASLEAAGRDVSA